MRYLLLIIIICSMPGCSKPASDIVSDTTKPVITIIAPVTSEIYRTGDPLCFKANVIDDNSLTNVQLKLFKASDMNSPVLQYNYPVSDKFLIVEEKIIIPESLNGSCVLQFEATDHCNNRAVSTLNFSSN